MRKGMEPVIVEAVNGQITITYPNPMDEDSVIYLNPEQVPLLIKWLQEAYEEIQGS